MFFILITTYPQIPLDRYCSKLIIRHLPRLIAKLGVQLQPNFQRRPQIPKDLSRSFILVFERSVHPDDIDQEPHDGARDEEGKEEEKAKAPFVCFLG